MNVNVSAYLFPERRHYLTAVLVSTVYLLMSFALIGFKADQLILVSVFCSLYLASAATRKFILGFSVFIVFWIIFDYMKAFPNYHHQAVHIKSLYDLEKNLFGIRWGSTILTPNEWAGQHRHTLLDVLSGFFYLCWIPLPLLFATFLFLTNKKSFLHFSVTFLITNLIGFLIYYLYPAAPPWYIEQYGFAFLPGTPGNPAGLTRFDAFFNVHLFESIYSKSSNVFAAMPSLHSSYLLVVLYYGIKLKMKYANLLFGLVAAGIWFSAIYTSHHYALDVLAGVLCAGCGIILFRMLEQRSKAFQKFMNNYLELIK
jgi:membrane-associated phospholipid phosphatase